MGFAWTVGRSSWWSHVRSAVLAAAVLCSAACDRKPSGGTSAGGATNGATNGAPSGTPKPAMPPNAVAVVFGYGSEKKLWIDEVAPAFNASGAKTRSGRPIVVDAKPMGSGELVDDVLEGRLKAGLMSPASKAFIELANAKQKARTGKPLVEDTRDLVMSPVVIAMWKPMAEALGWPGKPIGWAEIAAVTRNPQGWAAYGSPQWGRFKFGHTHPEYSNSGLMSAIALAYAGAGKTRDLTVEDLSKAEVNGLMAEVQRSVVHYGESTGFFGRKMFSNGPEFLSAAVLYESVVIESYDKSKYQTPEPIVAIYPKEGTFWTENPCGVVDMPWVGEEEREAAKAFRDYLLERPRQEAAMKYGFRPSDVSIPLGAPLDAEHGVNPKEPSTTLETPQAAVIDGVIGLWKKNKKRANVVLALDVSGSMNEHGRIQNAKAGAAEFVKLLSDEDTFSLLTFNNATSWALKGEALRTGREKAVKTVQGVIASGGTSIYDATDEAYRYLRESQDEFAITAVVVLTDGADRNSRLKLEQLLEQIKFDPETKNVRVFTIGYGGETDSKVLDQISNTTQARSYKGDPDNIRKVFKEIATFF